MAYIALKELERRVGGVKPAATAQMSDVGRPEGGGGNGPRAGWWKDYYAKPEVKKHRQKYLKDWRARQKRAIAQQWMPASSPPNNGRTVIICQVKGSCHSKDRVWMGWHDADGWFSIEGSEVEVESWQERPKPPSPVHDGDKRE